MFQVWGSVDVPAVSQRGANHLNFSSYILGTMRKNELKDMGSSGYNDGSLTNRLHTYRDLLGMIDFKSIKPPEYFGSSVCESLHVC